MKDQKILIIGGCGFIGSAIVEKYYKYNKIVVLDKCAFEGSSLDFRNLSKDNIKYIQGDATNLDMVMSLDKDFDYIINTAIVGMQNVVKNSINTIMTNINSCYNSLELASKQLHLKKFLTLSTSEVYGIDSKYQTEEEPTIIQSAVYGKWSYAASKTLSEHLTYAYHREKNIPIIILRPSNVFGGYRIVPNVITNFIKKALKNEDILIDGDGKQVRDFCYIDDLVNGIDLALKSEYTSEIFNLGNPKNEISIKDLAEKIVQVTNSKSKIIITNSKQPDVKFRSVCIDKAKKLLKYDPNITIEEGIKKVYTWIEKNINFF